MSTMMSTMATAANRLDEFQWQRQPRAEQLVRDAIGEFLERCPAAADLSRRMRDETGTRFIDWVDHFTLEDTPVHQRLLREFGFMEYSLDRTLLNGTFAHPGGIFPAVLLNNESRRTLAIRVQSIADFFRAYRGQTLSPSGFNTYRQQDIHVDERVRFKAVERHGWRGFTSPPDSDARAVEAHAKAFQSRPREFASEEDGFTAAGRLIDAAVADLGRDLACDLFFSAERDFWERRNQVAQFQKQRQDRLGLGWANHDHHTYRSSRRHFAALIGLFEKLGLTCRERFHAGREAGWGAQVMEQPTAGIVVFADVDLAAEELFIDFAHQPLWPRDSLGTVGLWCGLHGESILQAGMHHLECQFDFESLRRQMESAGMNVMKPFTDFPFLRQAFTEGERWPVSEHRLAALLAGKLIAPDQAERFRREGAIGSHLENLERNEGFKGFNQQGVNEIIAATDPRMASRG